MKKYIAGALMGAFALLAAITAIGIRDQIREQHLNIQE